MFVPKGKPAFPPLLPPLAAFVLLLAAAAYLPQTLPWQGTATQAVFQLAPPLLQLPDIQVQMLFSRQENLRQDALALTAKAMVNHLQPELADEDWEIQVVRLPLLSSAPSDGSVTGDISENIDENTPQSAESTAFLAREEDFLLAVALSLPPERGYLCLLEQGNQGYTLFYAEKDLLPIDQLSLWPFTTAMNGTGETGADAAPHLPAWLLATREHHDERLGAYSTVERFTLWLWQNDGLKQVFRTNTWWQLSFPDGQNWITARQQYNITGSGFTLQLKGSQEYFRSVNAADAQTWLEKTAPAWISHFRRQEPTEEITEETTALPEEAMPESGTLPAPVVPENLTALNRSINQAFTYSPQYQTFGLGEALWLPPAASSPLPVYVVENNSLALEAPFYPGEEEFLVKTKEGATALVPAAQISFAGILPGISPSPNQS